MPNRVLHTAGLILLVATASAAAASITCENMDDAALLQLTHPVAAPAGGFVAALQSLVGVPLSADSNATSETTPLGAVLKKPDDDLERQVGYEAGAFFMVTLNVSTAASGAGMVESDFGSPLCASAGRLVAFKGVGVVAGSEVVVG